MESRNNPKGHLAKYLLLAKHLPDEMYLAKKKRKKEKEKHLCGCCRGHSYAWEISPWTLLMRTVSYQDYFLFGICEWWGTR